MTVAAEHRLLAVDRRRLAQGPERAGARGREASSSSSPTSTGARPSCPAASASGWRSAARWCASPRSSCSTSRCPISTRSCACRCGSSSPSCTRSSATTMIYVTHDQIEAMTLADQIVVLDKGTISQVGSPLELYNHPANKFVAAFIGSPSMNFLAVDVADGGAGTGGGFATVALPGGRTARVGVRNGAPPAGAVELGVRPEHFRLVDPVDRGSGAARQGLDRRASRQRHDRLRRHPRRPADRPGRRLAHRPAWGRGRPRARRDAGASLWLGRRGALGSKSVAVRSRCDVNRRQPEGLPGLFRLIDLSRTRRGRRRRICALASANERDFRTRVL